MEGACQAITQRRLPTALAVLVGLLIFDYVIIIASVISLLRRMIERMHQVNAEHLLSRHCPDSATAAGNWECHGQQNDALIRSDAHK